MRKGNSHARVAVKNSPMVNVRKPLMMTWKNHKTVKKVIVMVEKAAARVEKAVMMVDIALLVLSGVPYH